MRELHKLYVKHACREYLENWPELVKYCGYREDNIPQLQDVNTFLKRKCINIFLTSYRFAAKRKKIKANTLNGLMIDTLQIVRLM